MSNCPVELTALAGLHGVRTTYLDVHRRTQAASPETLLAVLRALDVPLDSISDARTLIDERRRHIVRQGIEPVIVAWNGVVPRIDISLPLEHAAAPVRCRIQNANGVFTEIPHQQQIVTTEKLTDAAFIARAARSDDAASRRRDMSIPDYATLELSFETVLDSGCHQLNVETPGGTLESCIISAPDRAYENGTDVSRRWGCFLPLYALRTGRDWGSGDFSDLADLRRWVMELGGEMTATLPLLAAYLDEPCDPSPYAPASRLFWNELYVAPEQTPEFAECDAARQLVQSSGFQSAIAELRALELVDYRGVMRRKRAVLTLLAEQFFRQRPPRFRDYEQFAERRPQLRDYARFRATCERRRENWQRWPDRLREGELTPGDYDESAADYHCYVQWVANEQLQQLSSGSDGIDLDLPLGVRMDGYDVWRNRHAYAADAAAGAPPDGFFTKGQNWGFAPLHPEGIRRDGYRHVREFLTHHMEQASTLRLDHVMSLRRLYWVPHGLAPDQGAYVRYPMDELLALLCLESHRYRTMLVGENLGTVPPEVNEAMTRHGLRKMFVVQYECAPETAEPLPEVPQDCVASLNTHDMPTFAAWWAGDDIADRHDLGLLNAHDMALEQAGRGELRRRLIAALSRAGWLKSTRRRSARTDDSMNVDSEKIVRSLLQELAASPAEMVLVNLEDVWLETHPQNVPGTHLERPNWQRKTQFTFEQFRELPAVVACLREVDRLRRQPPRKRDVPPPQKPPPSAS